MNGYGEIIFGGPSVFQNLIYKGNFTNNECIDGDLYYDE